MNTIRCSIVEDLLPLYIDGALREETAQAVREHLSACPACRNEYEKLAQTLTLPSARKAVAALKSSYRQVYLCKPTRGGPFVTARRLFGAKK